MLRPMFRSLFCFLLTIAAPAAEHWSFQPVKAPAAGATVDSLLRAAQTHAGLTPAPAAAWHTLARRAAFALTGLPPEPEVTSGITDETTFAAAVDAWLASPHYGERMARHWMDVVRYADSKGHEYDFAIPGAWRYRDWLVRSFNDGVPLPQFIREHIAGDLLTNPRRHPQTGDNDSLPGTIFWNLGESATAESLYVRAAKLRPDDPKIKTALALAQFAKGEDQTALNTLESIAATDKGTVADLALISTRLRRKETDLALKAIEVLAQKTPDSPAPSNLRGRVLVERGEFAEARKNFEAALLKDPAFVAAAAGLANLDLRDKKPAEAQKRFADVLKANPRRTEASLALAELQLQGGAKRADVTPVYEAAIKASTGDASARVALVNHLLAANDGKAALSAAQQAASAMPGTPEVLDALGRAQQVTGEPNQALATFGKLAALIPKSPQPHIHSANVHLANKNPVVAMLSLRRALEIDPRSTEAQRLLMSVALSLKRPQDALDVAKTIQLQLPRDAAGFAFAGDVEAEQGHWDRAAAAYQQGVGKDNAGNLPSRTHLALKAAKQAVAAERFAEQWMKDHPRDSGFQFYLGDAAMAEGRLALAESRYEKVLAVQPQNAFALNNMAYLRLLQKKPGGRALAEKACAMLPDNPL